MPTGANDVEQCGRWAGCNASLCALWSLLWTAVASSPSGDGSTVGAPQEHAWLRSPVGV